MNTTLNKPTLLPTWLLPDTTGLGGAVAGFVTGALTLLLWPTGRPDRRQRYVGTCPSRWRPAFSTRRRDRLSARPDGRGRAAVGRHGGCARQRLRHRLPPRA